MKYMVVMSMMMASGLCMAQDSTPLDYFNRASREYIKEDKLTALKTLDKGLAEHPGDPRLLKLAEELLKEEEQQQQQEQQEQQDQQQQDQQQQDQQDQGEQDKGDQQDPGEQQSGDQQDRPQDQQGDDRQPQQQERKPGTIAPEDARRMLDALDRQEKEIQDKVRDKQRPAVRTPIEKDW